MEKHLFISCFAMFAMYIFVLMRMFIARVRDVRTGKIDLRYYKTYSTDAQVPVKTLQLCRNYANQLESPMLFYAVIALVLAMDLTHISLVVLAYVYVGARFLHMVIHTSNNRLYPRMFAFMISILVLAALWVRTLLLVLA